MPVDFPQGGICLAQHPGATIGMGGGVCRACGTLGDQWPLQPLLGPSLGSQPSQAA